MSEDTRAQRSEASNTMPKNEKFIIVGFRAMTPYILVDSYKLFGELCCSRPQDILTKEATCPFETLCTTYRLHSVMTQKSKIRNTV